MWNNLNKSFKNAIKAIIFIIPVLATFFGAKLVQEYRQIKANAGTDTANIFTQPQNLTLPSYLDLQVWVTVKHPVGFVATEITFDKSVIKLSSEIDTSPSPLKKKIIVTSKDEANSSGKIKIVSGLDPSDISSQANGTFRIANIKLEPIIDLKNLTSKLNFNIQNTQVIGMDESTYTITATNADIKINESTDPTSSPMATVTTATNTIVPIATEKTSIFSTNKKRGDVDKNGIVNILDIGRVVNTYDGDAKAHVDEDVNGDGKINILDLGVITDNYE